MKNSPNEKEEELLLNPKPYIFRNPLKPLKCKQITSVFVCYLAMKVQHAWLFARILHRQTASTKTIESREGVNKIVIEIV